MRLIYGVRAVREALASGGVVRLLVVEAASKELRGIVQGAQGAGGGVAVSELPRAQLDGLCKGGNHQGIAAEVGEFEYALLEDLLAVAEERKQAPLLLVLDGVQDPRNLGAALRAAECLGVHGVVIPKDRAASVTGAVVKASAGASEHVKVAQVTNVARALEELKERGVWCVGTSLEAKQAPWQLDLTAGVAIVIGGEAKGVRPLVLKTCDLTVRIPMAGQVGSLNAATAAGVLLYEVMRQRSSRGTPG
jgi:23S rRNA (guanosine2251-2'-O)-methyltransferase